jgi:hypothetical protein
MFVVIMGLKRDTSRRRRGVFACRGSKKKVMEHVGTWF